MNYTKKILNWTFIKFKHIFSYLYIVENEDKP